MRSLAFVTCYGRLLMLELGLGEIVEESHIWLVHWTGEIVRNRTRDMLPVRVIHCWYMASAKLFKT